VKSAVVFLGPSCPLVEARSVLGTAEYRRSAVRGDITSAFEAGFREIVLIDGRIVSD